MLLTKTHRTQLLANGKAMAETDISETVKPVVKLFMPDGGATWLLAWLEPDDIDIAFGLCDLGLGCAELGFVRISEIASLRGAVGLPLLGFSGQFGPDSPMGHVMPFQPMVERDRTFKAERSLSDYASADRAAGYIAA